MRAFHMYFASVIQNWFSETEKISGTTLKNNLVKIALCKIFRTDLYISHIKKIIARQSDKQLFGFYLSLPQCLYPIQCPKDTTASCSSSAGRSHLTNSGVRPPYVFSALLAMASVGSWKKKGIAGARASYMRNWHDVLTVGMRRYHTELWCLPLQSSCLCSVNGISIRKQKQEQIRMSATVYLQDP